ncbi:MAG: 3-dehydroquinate synthase [Muribaculaceae bacterium]|nr:3-dehydroquinate synthase [Muribaculaceae bacterium]
MAKNDARIIATEAPGRVLDEMIWKLNPASTVVITDKNVEEKVLPRMEGSRVITKSPRIVLEPGEANKDLKSLAEVWWALSAGGHTRQSVAICIGGGMVTDLGGFAAATFKRGIRHINIPTTLLGAVDAAIGGKTGIDLGEMKNEIGTFRMPHAVIISAGFLTTLPQEEMISGYGEMLKTGMAASPDLYFDICDTEHVLSDPRFMEVLASECARFKSDIVAADPWERGLRKVLNLGHTAGHAFEEIALGKGKPLPHGCAVAYGLLTAMLGSKIKFDFNTGLIQSYAHNILKPWFPQLPVGCADRDRVMELMAGDKKNTRHGEVAFTLLRDLGDAVPDVVLTPAEIETALDLTFEMLGR